MKRSAFWLAALDLLNARIPYVWGGKSIGFVPGAKFATGGLDCSGFVTSLVHQVSCGALDWRATHNTDRLWTELPRVEVPELGDLVLYFGPASSGPNDVEHVMVYAGADVVIGQAFGGRLNVGPEYSVPRRHWTRALPLRYREKVAGFVRLPWA